MVKNTWKSYIWTADKDVNESDPRSNVHYLGSSENKAENDLLERNAEVAPFICHCAAVQVWFTQPVHFSHRNLANWENIKLPGRFFNSLPFNHL